MKRDEFVDRCADFVDEYFPKGKTKMRGEAMVLVAMITKMLVEEGIIDDE